MHCCVYVCIIYVCVNSLLLLLSTLPLYAAPSAPASPVSSESALPTSVHQHPPQRATGNQLIICLPCGNQSFQSISSGMRIHMMHTSYTVHINCIFSASPLCAQSHYLSLLHLGPWSLGAETTPSSPQAAIHKAAGRNGVYNAVYNAFRVAYE